MSRQYVHAIRVLVFYTEDGKRHHVSIPNDQPEEKTRGDLSGLGWSESDIERALSCAWEVQGY